MRGSAIPGSASRPVTPLVPTLEVGPLSISKLLVTVSLSSFFVLDIVAIYSTATKVGPKTSIVPPVPWDLLSNIAISTNPRQKGG